MESNLRRLRSLSLVVTVFAILTALVGTGLIGWTAKEEFFPQEDDTAPVLREEIVYNIEPQRPDLEAIDSASQEAPEDGIYYRSEGYDPETDTFINEEQFEAEGYTTPELGGDWAEVYYDEYGDPVQMVVVEGDSADEPEVSPFPTREEFFEVWFTPVGLGLTALLIFGLTFFVAALMWVWRAHENMRSHGIRLKHTPRRAVANYFVPGLNLVLPFEAMRELYNRSEGEPDEFANVSVSDVNAWWTCVAVGLMVFVFLFAKELINITQPLYFITPPWMDSLIVSFALLLLLGSVLLFAGLTRKISGLQSGYLPHVEPQELVEEPRLRPTVRIITGNTQ